MNHNVVYRSFVFVLAALIAGAAIAPVAVRSARSQSDDLYALVSEERLIGYLEDLTAIQPYSGWRNSATEGEAEALDYVAASLGDMAYLNELGAAVERQTFSVFMSTEIWESRLHLTVGGESVEVPADGLRGPRDDIGQALRFDTDGTLNDDARNPQTAEGEAAFVPTLAALDALTAEDVAGKVVFLNYALINQILHGTSSARGRASYIVNMEPAALVLVTQFSTAPGDSHGAFVGDTSAMNYVESETKPPVIYARMEDMAAAGIESWSDLVSVEAAQVVLDADVFSPGESGNLAARIPGEDSSRAVILGAHIDSPNAPGAMDDGSGSAVLLEVAYVLNEAQVQPPVDLYLVWFGSEEIGLYGSAHFALTHQELLDRTLAMLQIDCLSYMLDGIGAGLGLVTWPYGHLGDDSLTWPDYLEQAAAGQGIQTYPTAYYGVESDSSSFAGFDVPHANLIYSAAPSISDASGGYHYTAMVHSPYDTAELAAQVSDVLADMTRVALGAAVEAGRDAPALRVAPAPTKRAVFVGTHTESAHMNPTTFVEFGMALAWQGFDVDVLPYGEPVTAEAVADADMVVVLPTVDYPSPDGAVDVYDEAWRDDEIDVLDAYVDGGGFLVLTNSAYRLKYHNRVLDPNEDTADLNALAGRFGIAYQDDAQPVAGQVLTRTGHALMRGQSSLALIDSNAVPFTMDGGEVLAEYHDQVIVGLAAYGGGEVLALADVGILGAQWEPQNLRFWQNVAQYVYDR